MEELLNFLKPLDMIKIEIPKSKNDIHYSDKLTFEEIIPCATDNIRFVDNNILFDTYKKDNLYTIECKVGLTTENKEYKNRTFTIYVLDNNNNNILDKMVVNTLFAYEDIRLPKPYQTRCMNYMFKFDKRYKNTSISFHYETDSLDLIIDKCSVTCINLIEDSKNE